jgi:hypothetical protein
MLGLLNYLWFFLIGLLTVPGLFSFTSDTFESFLDNGL